MTRNGDLLHDGDARRWHDWVPHRHGVTVVMGTEVFAAVQTELADPVVLVRNIELPAYTPPDVSLWGYSRTARTNHRLGAVIVNFEYPRLVHDDIGCYDERPAIAVLASIAATSRALRSISCDAIGPQPQALMITSILIGGPGDYGLNARLSGSTARWIKGQPEAENIPHVSRVMMDAHRRLYNPRQLSGATVRDFAAKMNPQPKFGLWCPGDRSCLFSEHALDEHRGGELGSHNLDTATQVLTLIAGLAAFNVFVRVGLTATVAEEA